MLGKLIKNELKAVNRLMIPLHLGLIAATIVGRFYLQFTVFNNPARAMVLTQNVWYNILNVMLVFFYIIGLAAVALITSIYLNILRFRKNLFTDEGYLMHTLPVSAHEHIWSKLIVAFIWQMADILLILVSILSMFVNMDVLRLLPDIFSELSASFPEAFGIPAAAGIPLYFLLFLIDSISGILIVSMCIAVGHSFNSHKILSSVAIYVGVMVAQSVIATILGTIFGIVSYTPSLFVSVYDGTTGAAAFWVPWLSSMLLSLATGAVGYVLTNYFMSRRLNLE